MKKQKVDIIPLVEDLKKGSQKAMSDLYDNYSGALYGVILQIVKDQDVAQDLLQDVFVTIWQKVSSYDDTKGSFFTWMLNIARNKSIDQYRKEKRVSDGLDRFSYEKESDSTSSELNIHTIGIKEMTQKIPKDRLEILELVYFKGYTQQEISDELDIPLGTVKTRVRLGLKELRKFFSYIFWI